MTRDFIIDTDTASDDAVALLMALRWHDVTVRAVTVVSGNVDVDQAATNALYTAELCGVDVPVYKGARQPLIRKYENAHWFHGEDGMGNQHYPAPKRQPEPGHAVDALIETIKAYPGCVLVTLGPLTNVALAVSRAPEIAKLVSRCVVMGGAAATNGNVTPAAEYNVWVDPDAARIVFHSGLPIEMVGWEFCQGEFVITDDEMAQIRQFNTPYAQFTLDCNTVAIQAYHVQTGEHGLSLPDPVAMSVALDPTICTHSDLHYVDVETHSDLTRGMTVVDKLHVAKDARNQSVWRDLIGRDPHIRVCWALDAARWKEALYKVLEG